MSLSTVLFASEVNFLTGFAELKIYDDFADSDTYAARVLWGVRLIFLSLLFGLWAYQGFGTAFSSY